MIRKIKIILGYFLMTWAVVVLFNMAFSDDSPVSSFVVEAWVKDGLRLGDPPPIVKF